MQRRSNFLFAGLAIAALALGLLLAACGEGEEEGAPTATVEETVAQTPQETPARGAQTPGASAELEIAAENIAFDQDELTAPADAPFTIVFDNRDDGIRHNLALYRDEEYEDLIDMTEEEAGPTTQTLDVGPLAAGEYYFRCEVHPTRMQGELLVE